MLREFRFGLLIFASTLALSACGNKGPLVLPDPAPAAPAPQDKDKDKSATPSAPAKTGGADAGTH